MKKMNYNPIAQMYKKEYLEQTKEIQEKLDYLKTVDSSEYQFKIIKRQNMQPEVGDVFLVCVEDGLYFSGLVINSNINNINGDNLSVVFLFKKSIYSIDEKDFTFDMDNLLIEPCTVGIEYWKRGLFYNTGTKVQIPNDLNYGFYHIGKKVYVNEYEQEILEEPVIKGLFAVSTIIGVASKVKRQLIIHPELMECPKSK